MAQRSARTAGGAHHADAGAAGAAGRCFPAGGCCPPRWGMVACGTTEHGGQGGVLAAGACALSAGRTQAFAAPAPPLTDYLIATTRPRGPSPTPPPTLTHPPTPPHHHHAVRLWLVCAARRPFRAEPAVGGVCQVPLPARCCRGEGHACLCACALYGIFLVGMRSLRVRIANGGLLAGSGSHGVRRPSLLLSLAVYAWLGMICKVRPPTCPHNRCRPHKRGCVRLRAPGTAVSTFGKA